MVSGYSGLYCIPLDSVLYIKYVGTVINEIDFRIWFCADLFWLGVRLRIQPSSNELKPFRLFLRYPGNHLLLQGLVEFDHVTSFGVLYGFVITF